MCRDRRHRSSSGPDSCLVGIMTQEAADGGGEPFLLAVELADLEPGSGLGAGHIDAGECDGPASAPH